jgi:hypothetical protein
MLHKSLNTHISNMRNMRTNNNNNLQKICLIFYYRKFVMFTLVDKTYLINNYYLDFLPLLANIYRYIFFQRYILHIFNE